MWVCIRVIIYHPYSSTPLPCYPGIRTLVREGNQEGGYRYTGVLLMC